MGAIVLLLLSDIISDSLPPLIQETEPSPAKLRKTESRHRSFGNTQTPSPPTHTHRFRKIMTPIFLMFFFPPEAPGAPG